MLGRIIQCRFLLGRLNVRNVFSSTGNRRRFYDKTKSSTNRKPNLSKSKTIEIKMKPSSKSGRTLSGSSKQPVNDYMTDIRFARDVILQIGSGIALAFCISEYGFNTTVCEGPSMMPTLHDEGDVIFFEKFSHKIFGLDGGESGFDRAQKRMKDDKEIWNKSKDKEYQSKLKNKSITQTTAKDHSIWTRLTSGVVVGDVIVCNHPRNEGTICKRVIALPGDVVELHRSLRYSAQPEITVVPDGHVWVEGDNSNNSNDSRHYGAISSTLIVGKVLFRLWPVSKERMIIDRCLPGGIKRLKDKPFTGSSVTPAGVPLTKFRHI